MSTNFFFFFFNYSSSKLLDGQMVLGEANYIIRGPDKTIRVKILSHTLLFE